MKAIVFLKNSAMVLACVAAMACFCMAQKTVDDANKPRLNTAKDKDAKKPIPLPAPTIVDVLPGDGEPEPGPEADAVLPYYSNYLKEYRLGPSDMISIEVFGQCPDYCKTGITIPPNARISYPLVRDGVMVAGKTVEQVANEIT